MRSYLWVSRPCRIMHRSVSGDVFVRDQRFGGRALKRKELWAFERGTGLCTRAFLTLVSTSMVLEFPIAACRTERSSTSFIVTSAPRSINRCTVSVPPMDAARNRGVLHPLARESMCPPWIQKFYSKYSRGNSFHVTGVCLLSQSASERHSQEIKAHKPLRIWGISLKTCLPCLIIIQSCYFDCRIDKLSTSSGCLISVSFSIHVILPYYGAQRIVGFF